MSREHFSVDGTLLEAWASMKSFREKDDADGDHNGWDDFRGEQRSNDTHESKTDPEAKLMRKGKVRRSRFRGKRRTQLAAYMVGAAYNLLRLNKLLRVAR